MKKKIIEFLLKKYQTQIYEMAGNLALRFYDDPESGDYEDLREKFYYWIIDEISHF